MMMNTPPNDNTSSEEEWSAPEVNHIVPRDRTSVVAMALSIISYIVITALVIKCALCILKEI